MASWLYRPALCCIAILLATCQALSHPDEVTFLPGLKEQPTFKHYSGYLNASNGRYLHYWFVESQNSPQNDPLVLWMNGGPGCSSLDGFLTELGPIHVNSDAKTLYYNDYAWNKVANVIFLEAPAGVGFSYSDDRRYATDDDQVAADNYLALQHFFAKFPEFAKHEFYITGESYGGIYIPTLSVNVLTGPAPINFKGFAIGNGFLDSTFLTNSIVFFGYYHGLFGITLWKDLTSNCCHGGVSQNTCSFSKPMNQGCASAVQQVRHIIQGSGLNVYNLYSDCAFTASAKNSRLRFDMEYLFPRLFKDDVGAQTLRGDPPCIDTQDVADWINQPVVRQALHIPSAVQNWSVCSDDVGSQYQTLYDTMKPQVLKLLRSNKLRGLIYNGDVDMACNFLGDQWFVNDLNLPLLSDYRMWHFNQQVAGFVKEFRNLTLLTIKGSGHMVPQDKPGPAFKMISSFLFQKPY